MRDRHLAGVLLPSGAGTCGEHLLRTPALRVPAGHAVHELPARQFPVRSRLRIPATAASGVHMREATVLLFAVPRAARQVEAGVR